MEPQLSNPATIKNLKQLTTRAFPNRNTIKHDTFNNGVTADQSYFKAPTIKHEIFNNRVTDERSLTASKYSRRESPLDAPAANAPAIKPEVFYFATEALPNTSKPEVLFNRAITNIIKVFFTLQHRLYQTWSTLLATGHSQTLANIWSIFILQK